MRSLRRSGSPGVPSGHRTDTAILLTTYPGQPTAEESARRAASGLEPRRSYIELARRLPADLVDIHYLHSEATVAAQVLSKVSIPAAQVLEAWLRRGRYRHVCAWADRLGLPLALLNKVSSSSQDIVMLSSWLTPRKKSLFLRPLGAHTHLRALVSYGTVQLDAAAAHGVDASRLHHLGREVDEKFWSPQQGPTERLIAAVGWTTRDYATLIHAVRGLDVRVEIVVGHAFQPPGPATGQVKADVQRLHGVGVPPNVLVHEEMTSCQLRDLYARSAFVVVPLMDTDFDAGSTTVGEAMAMGKAVVLSRTTGQVDLVHDGLQGVYVRPGDPRSLRIAIEQLLEDSTKAARMGAEGRRTAMTTLAFDSYVDTLASIVDATRGRDSGAAPG